MSKIKLEIEYEGDPIVILDILKSLRMVKKVSNVRKVKE